MLFELDTFNYLYVCVPLPIRTRRHGIKGRKGVMDMGNLVAGTVAVVVIGGLIAYNVTHWGRKD